MDAKYPLFVIAEYDKTLEMLEDESNLSILEENDVVDGLYSGWDVVGRPLKIEWCNEQRQIVYLSDSPELQNLKHALLNYIKLYVPDKKLPHDLSEYNALNLFKLGQNYIRQNRSIFRKFCNLFRRNTCNL